MAGQEQEPREGAGAATLAGFGAILLWSMTVALARSLGERVGPVRAAGAVYSVGGLYALACLAASRRRTARPPARYLFGCGALFTGYTVLLFAAVGLAGDRRQAMEIGLVNYLWPLLTLLFCLALLRRRPRPLLLPGTMLALGGLFLVVTGEGGAGLSSLAANLAANPAAYALGLAAAISWALYSALTRAWAGGRAAGGVDLFLPATAAVLLAASLFSPGNGAWGPRPAGEALILGTATFFAYRMWDASMRRGNIMLVAAASYLTPLFSSLFSALYLGVAPGALFWAGCLMLVAGSAASWRAATTGSSAGLPRAPRS